MITTFYPPYNFGGDGVFVQHLSNELARRGHYVEVIHCIDAYRVLARQKPLRTYQDHPHVTVHGLRSSFGFLSPLATHQTGFPLFKSAHIQKILEKGFDVIHYHNISLFGPKILEYGKGIKLYTMHEYWLGCPTHILFKFNRSPCTQPLCFFCSLTYKRPPQWWRYLPLLKVMVKHVDAFIALSQFSKDIHDQMGLALPIVHIPGFVPNQETAPSNPNPSIDRISGEPYFLFVGRLKKLKGLQTLIPVFRQYRKAKLLIAGTGEDKPSLQRLAEGMVNIQFLGYLSGPKLEALYRSAIALIVPSICFESFPLVILEAFRTQTPVIVRNLGGMPESVKESGGGFVYDTEEELIAAMDKLLEDPSCRHELGLRGYQAYQRNWTDDVHLKRYLGLIHDIAMKRGQTLE
jgi:glycosyltransferase involved in cell wall biosynthesis